MFSSTLTAASNVAQSSMKLKTEAEVRLVRSWSFSIAGLSSPRSSSSWANKLPNVLFQCFHSFEAESKFASMSSRLVYAVDVIATRFVLNKLNWKQVEILANSFIKHKIKVFLRDKEISLLDWKRNGNAACHCNRKSGTVLANYWHKTKTLGEASKMLDTFAFGICAACDQPHSIWLSLSYCDCRADWTCCSLLTRCVAITSPVQAPSNEVARHSISEENDCCVAHGRIGQIYRCCENSQNRLIVLYRWLWTKYKK